MWIPRLFKGVSDAIATAVLIIIAIALIAGVWLFSQRFVRGGDVASVKVFVTQSTFIGVNQVVTLSVRVENKMDSPLVIRTLRIVCDRGGTLTTLIPYSTTTPQPTTLPSATTIAGAGVTVGFAGNNFVGPKQNTEFAMTINFGNRYVSIIQVIVEAVDPAGREYTLTSNEVKLS